MPTQHDAFEGGQLLFELLEGLVTALLGQGDLEPSHLGGQQLNLLLLLCQQLLKEEREGGEGGREREREGGRERGRERERGGGEKEREIGREAHH